MADTINAPLLPLDNGTASDADDAASAAAKPAAAKKGAAWTFGNAVGSVGNYISFVKAEILIDFVQIVNVLYVGRLFPDNARHFVGRLVRLACLDAVALKQIAPFKLFITAFLWFFFGFFLLIFWRKTRRVRRVNHQVGLELKNFDDMSKFKRRILETLAFLLCSLYLPVVQAACEALACTGAWQQQAEGICHDGPSVGFSIGVLLLYGLVTPLYMSTLINRNKPLFPQFDTDGVTRLSPAEQGRRYEAALANDKCPVRFLYRPYTRHFSDYKLFVMFAKLLLVLIAVFASADNCHLRKPYKCKCPTEIVPYSTEPSCKTDIDYITLNDEARVPEWIEILRSILTLLLLALYLWISYRASPFHVRENNMLERTQRVSAVVMAVVPTLMACQLIDSEDRKWGYASVLIFLADGAVTLCMWVGNNQKVKKMWGNLVGNVKLTDGGKYLSQPDLRNERLSRLWCYTWDNLLTRPPFASTRKTYKYACEGSTPYLLDFGGTVQERHIENKEIVATVGLARYVFPSEADRQVLRALCESFVGADVWFDEGNSHPFGKMYVIPMPATVYLAYDNGKTEVLTDPKKWRSLLNTNMDPAIQRKVTLRRQLRALDGCTINYEFDAYHKKQKSRQRSRQVYDSTTGSSRTEYYTEYYTLNVHFYWKVGVVKVWTDGNAIWTADNGMLLNMINGKGTDEEGTDWTGETHTLNPDNLGLTGHFDMTPQLRHVIEDNIGIVNQYYSLIVNNFAAYSGSMLAEMDNKSFVLSYDFHRNVYLNDRLTREQLATELRRERNRQVSDLMGTHEVFIDQMFATMDKFNGSHRYAVWYCFWHDAWHANQSLKIVTKNADVLDPSLPTAWIRGDVIPRDKLHNMLVQRKLAKSKGSYGFGVKLLDVLYTAMEGYQPPAPPLSSVVVDKRVDVAEAAPQTSKGIQRA